MFKKITLLKIESDPDQVDRFFSLVDDLE